ncbi:MAG: hypothetical protein U1E17_09000 [Geminicoccaceae bacterium]
MIGRLDELVPAAPDHDDGCERRLGQIFAEDLVMARPAQQMRRTSGEASIGVGSGGCR